MKMTTGRKRVVYQLIALGTRSCEIERKINEQFPAKDGNIFTHQQVSDYCRRFKALEIEEQISYLPYNMNTSFALQEVRINADIRAHQRLDEELKKSDANIVEIERAKLSIRNRISQELGQNLAFAKGGAGGGNLNVLQMQINKFRINVNNTINLSSEDRLELLKRANIIEANVKQIKQE